VRYADGGGLTSAGRQRRERVRQQAADLFAAGVSAVDVAARLEVSTKSAYAWRRAWVAGGAEALASKGSSGPATKLSEKQLLRLQHRLEAGPAASGYTEDRRWTLARVVKLIAAMFHVRYSIKGASLVRHRMGWTPQMPSHRAVERDEAAIASWRRHRWTAVKGRAQVGCVDLLRRRPHLHRHASADRGPALATRLHPACVRARTEPGREGVVSRPHDHQTSIIHGL
jgi:putative transposase